MPVQAYVFQSNSANLKRTLSAYDLKLILKVKNMSFKILTFMKDFTTYLSTAPVVALAWFSFTAGFIIEINRFFPDPLVFSF